MGKKIVLATISFLLASGKPVGMARHDYTGKLQRPRLASTMGSVGFPLQLSACILFFLILENFCVTCDQQWCYDKPECGPSTWRTIGSCGGMRQSPINIDLRKVIYDDRLGPIYSQGYQDRKIVKQIKNTGYQLQLTFQSKATISGPGLPAVYWLHSAHWHWGTQNTSGAEHTINGQRYTMEMHVIHTKNNMSLEDAKKDPEGLLVLAFFVWMSEGVYYITPWATLANLLYKIPEKDNSWDLNGEFSLGDLLRTADSSSYFRYRGSLTTPNCEESVIWIVFRQPIRVHTRVVGKMTNSLYFTTIQENRRMQNNFRFVQPLNGRNVYYYQAYKELNLLTEKVL